MTGTFDINGYEGTIRDTLRAWLYPQCLHGTDEHTLSTTVNFSVAQSFIPFSQCHTTVAPYTFDLAVSFKARKYGTPDGVIVVSLQGNSNDAPSGTTISSRSIVAASVPSTLGVVSATLPLNSRLGSYTKYWLVLTPANTASETDYYAIGKDSVDTHYWKGSALEREEGQSWSPLGLDLYFDIDVPNLIYTGYPREDLSIYSYPRLGVKIVGRPRVIRRWITKSMREDNLTCVIAIYSRYIDELDDLVSLTDRALWIEQTSLSNIEIVTPGPMEPPSVIRENIFRREVSYEVKVKIDAV